MNIQQIINIKSRVPKPLYRRKLEPIRRFRVINFKGQSLPDLIRPSSNHEHERANKERGVLVPVRGQVVDLIGLVGRPDPVPLAVPVPPEAPCVIEGALVGGPAAEDDHHAVGAAGGAGGGGVVHTDGGLLEAGLDLAPGVGGLVEVEGPDVAHRLGACGLRERAYLCCRRRRRGRA
jgi:hypothetical protein